MSKRLEQNVVYTYTGILAFKQKVVYTYNDILVSFKKETLTYAATWTNLEDTMLS